MWGVIVSDEDAPMYWTLPNMKPYFCQLTFRGWQYVAFKTNDEDTDDRYAVEDAVRESRLIKILSRKTREYHDEHNPCDPPIPGSRIHGQRQDNDHDDYIVRRPNYQ
ncbi:hypothetical protein L596_012240 [Steinernema carpocapsae]|uniref:Uncharacterized protein n=1 Tax=Steinernema carpocapsae TaxID=34508 RepID=A0A4U5NXA5_STECR|nr:hypothetical protein L596_012240 [Steinernema carpocapsae]